MKTLYPTPTYLSVLLRILLRVERHEGQHLTVDFQSLDIVQGQKLVRDLPMYCDSVVLRLDQKDNHAVDTINRFRLGKSKEDLDAMETVIGIMLDRDHYEKAPLAKHKLSIAITEFLWHFKERLDFEVWQLLQQNFDMTFVVLKDDLPFLKKHMGEIVEKLQNLNGPVPFYSLEKTQHFIRGKLREYSQYHEGIVSLKREILEEQLRQEHDLLHDEYIPFYESLFVSWNVKGLRLLDVSPEAISFVAMHVLEEKIIAFNEHTSELNIQGKIIKITKHKSQWNLLRIISKDRQSQEKDWQFSELKEMIDYEKKDKDYYNSANQLKLHVEREGFKDFLVTTSHSVQINPQYLEES